MDYWWGIKKICARLNPLNSTQEPYIGLWDQLIIYNVIFYSRVG